MNDFTPIETQEELDRIISASISREREYTRKWEGRAKINKSDADTYRREARKWETRARENLAVVKAHESTIARFIDRLDDVLTDENDD